nr:hypothetical protein BaRGS_014024 [Batillaria attramentaria]
MEYRAFGFFSSIVPGCVPTPVFYDRDLRIRQTLESMVDLIRIFHYERPFDPADPGKRCAKDVLLRLDDVYKDVTVMAAKERVKQQFAESVECLIHGDLHIDSVIASGDDFKMVDAEFVRLGPCAYDMGLLLATLVLVYHHHKHVLEHQDDMQGHDLDCSLKTTAAEKKHEGQEAAGDFEQENGGPSHFDFMDSSPAAQVDCIRTAIAVLHNLDRVTSVPELVHVIAT